MTITHDIPTAETDVRIEILQSLLRTPHDNLADLAPLHRDAIRRDPLFYAHVSVYIFDTSSVRDHKTLVVAHLLTAPYARLREEGFVLLQSLPIHQVRQSVDYAKETLDTFPRIFKGAVTEYLRALEGKGRKFDNAVVRNREHLKRLYGYLHIKPSPNAQALLFDEEPLPRSKAAIVRRITHATDAAEQARLIVEHRIPYTVAVGAVTRSTVGLTPATRVAIVTQMSAAEIRNHQKLLKNWGMIDHPEVKELIKQKIAEGASDKRVSIGKTDKAIAAAQEGGDEEIVAALREARDIAIVKGTRIGGTVALLIDKSSSMKEAIERGKQLAARLAAHADTLKVYTFDKAASETKLPKGATLTQIEREFQMVTAGGMTAIGSPLARMAREKVAADLVIVISDYEETAPPSFAETYPQYVLSLGKRPEVVAIGVGQANRYRHVVSGWELSGIPTRYLDWTAETSDHYAIDNLIELVAAPDYAQMIEAIMDLPLPERVRRESVAV